MSRTYLCIGVGPGIGFRTAVRFAREDFQVFLVSRNEERLKNLADEFKRFTGKSAKIYAADAGDANQMKNLPLSCLP